MTIVQRRLLAEDGVLDYKGPGATKATPDAVANGTFDGVGGEKPGGFVSLKDRIEQLLKKRLASKK